MELQPTLKQDRLATLDILRGVSLLGIILVNILAFNIPLPYIDTTTWFTTPEDIIAQQNLDIYVQGSFYPLFAMLFGYGLSMQWLKAQANGKNFLPLGMRRMLVLLIIGILHAVLIWWGDILMMYAVFGTLLLLFLRFSPSLLLVLGLLLNSMLQILLFIFTKASDIPVSELYYADITAIERVLAAYGAGSWGDAFTQRLADISMQMNVGMWFSGLFTILPYMLIGAAAAKWHLVERAKDFKFVWLVAGIIITVVGVYIKMQGVVENRTAFDDYLKTYVGGPLLALGYASLIIALCTWPKVTKLLRPFATVGRMSLTTYLMQSVLLSLLFYNFGFGWYGKISVPSMIYVALGIFVAQVIIAEIWLSKFKQGPVEMLWRKLTYKKSNV